MPRSFLLCHRRYKPKWRFALRHAADEMAALDVEGFETDVCLGLSGELPSFSSPKNQADVWHEDDDALGGYDSAGSARSFTDLQPAAMSPRSDSSGDCVVPQLPQPLALISTPMHSIHQLPLIAMEPPKQGQLLAKQVLHANNAVQRSACKGSAEISPVPSTPPSVGWRDTMGTDQPVENLPRRKSMMDALLEQVRAARSALKDTDVDIISQLEESQPSVTYEQDDEHKTCEIIGRTDIPDKTDTKYRSQDVQETHPTCEANKAQPVTTEVTTNAEEHDEGGPCCSDCGDSFESLPDLESHRNSKQGSCKKARRCPHCEKMYVSLPAYSMHIRTHGAGCQCPYCGKRFSRPWLLQGHIRTHTGEKPFSCPQCHKAFADKSNLRAHIQTHSSAKPFVCGRCGKAFALKSYLYKHEESSCLKK